MLIFDFRTICKALVINKVAPATAAVTDASGSDVLVDEVVADGQEAVVEADQASIDTVSTDTSAAAAATSTDEGSNKKKFW